MEALASLSQVASPVRTQNFRRIRLLRGGHGRRQKLHADGRPDRREDTGRLEPSVAGIDPGDEDGIGILIGDRQMFGGGLNTVWPFARVALHYLDGFSERYSRAVTISEEWIRGLQRQERFAVERIPSGTNLFRLRVKNTDAEALRKRLAARGVMLPAPQGDAFLIGVNETLNRTTASELTDAFARALA
jgi:hypothetical protein